MHLSLLMLNIPVSVNQPALLSVPIDAKHVCQHRNDRNQNAHTDDSIEHQLYVIHVLLLLKVKVRENSFLDYTFKRNKTAAFLIATICLQLKGGSR